MGGEMDGALDTKMENGIMALKGKSFRKSPIQEYGKRATFALFGSPCDQ